MLLLQKDAFSGLDVLKARYDGGMRPSEDLAGWALSWQLTGKQEFADKALAALKQALPLKEGTSRSYTKFIGVSLAFDWLYENRAFDLALKDQVASQLLEAADNLLRGADLKIPEQSSYHNYVLRYLSIAIFSIAAASSHEKTKVRSQELAARTQIAFENILALTDLVTPRGSYHESMDYFRITLVPLVLLAELQRTMLGSDPARRYSVFENLGPTYLYKLMPNGTPSREGDNEYPVLDDKDTALLGYAVHRFKDPYSAWTLRKSGFVPQKWILPVLEFLWNDPAVVPRDPALASSAELPRQRYFAGVGHLVMRNGWAPNATWIEFDCGPYFSKHQHLSQNHFSIYHRGYLAIDSGADYTDTESPHYLNYYRRTVAHNSILVYDPRERFFWSDNVWDAVNDGGQRMDSSRFWNTVRSMDDWEHTRNLWNLGQMHNVDFVDGKYHYALGDATHAYSSNKMKQFTRELLYLQETNHLLVFDHVISADPAFRKVWLLHGVNEPDFAGTGTHEANGATNFGDAKEFRFIEGEGELLVRCLLPASRSVLKRGGQGFEFWTPGDARGGDWGSGKTWPLEPAEGGPLPDDPQEKRMWKLFWGEEFNHIERSNRKNVVAGAWRVEIAPTEPAREDFFLNVLEIGDKGSTGKRRVEALKGQNVVGAAIENGTIALFNSGPSPLREAEVTFPDVSCQQLLISGLEANSLFEIEFLGPNVMTPASTVPPGIEVKRVFLRSNENGILRTDLEGLRSVRLRLARV